MRYVTRDVDVASAPHLVVDAIVAELAFRLFGPLCGNPNSKDESDVQQSFSALARSKLEDAKAAEIEEHAYAGAPSASAVTDLDVCNRALSVIGNDRTVWSLEKDSSGEAVRCRQLLPMARRHVLAAHPWEFAQKTSSVSSDRRPPSDFVRLVSAQDESGRPVNCRVQNGLVGGSASSIRYVADALPLDSYPPSVLEAVVLSLAAYLSAYVQTPQEGGGSTAAVGERAEEAIARAAREEAEEAVYRVTPSDPSAVAETDVCNRALSVLGSRIVLKDFRTDTSAEANACRQFLPMARRHVLAAHPWEFATVEADAEDGGEVPSDFVCLVGASGPAGETAVCRVVAGRFRGEDVSRVKYVSDSVGLAHWPAWVQEAVMLALAVSMYSVVAGVQEGGQEGGPGRMGYLVDQASKALSAAVAKEADEAMYRATPSDPSAVARTDIANRALAMAGSAVVLKDLDTDVSAEANRCRQFLQVAVRTTLQAHDWDFATECAQVPLCMSGGGWARIEQPAGCVRIVGVNDMAGHALAVRRAREGVLVRANGVGGAVVRFVSDDVDVSDFPRGFAECVVYRLAALISGSLLKSAAERAELMAMADHKLSATVTDESNETAVPGEWENPFLKARG